MPELERPEFSVKDASLLLEENYGLCCTLEELPGERDRNYLVQEIKGETYVLKISNSCETLEFLQVQHDALERSAKLLEHGRIPKIFPDKNGESHLRVSSADGSQHWMRLVRYVDGLPMAKYRPHTGEFLQELGRMCGTVAKALHEIPAPPPSHTLLWEMHNVQETLHEYMPWIKDEKLLGWVKKSLALYSRTIEALDSKLRRGWIHNDFNDYNVLAVPKISGNPDLGLIDFGDMTHSYLAAEPAVACAYAMLNKPDPLEAAALLIRGFNQHFPLEEKELEILFPMIMMRLCLSLTLGAFQQQNDPENEYLGISQKPARVLLERLQVINPRFAHYLFRDACNLEACPASFEFLNWYKKADALIHNLLGETLNPEKTAVLDLSVSSFLSAKTEGVSLEKQQHILDEYLGENNAEFGVGKYTEARSFYAAKDFRNNSIDGEEKRTIHLGIDVFASSGTSIYAPIAGVVHQLQDNHNELDYGPTVILCHKFKDGPEFYTLYGHLGRECLQQLQIGQVIKGGMPLAKIGNSNVNGGWLPHVHFQLILDLFDFDGNYPGVALPSVKNVWTSICPDPGLMLGLDSESSAEKIDSGKLLKRRNNVFGPSLSLSYQDPLIIVRGQAQSLIDSKGQFYLDCVNNVAHVGHSHPEIAKAQSNQAYVLNTNTRYLNPLNIEYAERLCALFPEPLDTCFLVCSGSEANELAMRIAGTVSGQKDMIVLEHAYHGNTKANIDISPYKHNGPGGKGAPEWVHQIPMPYLYRGLHRDPETAGKLYADEVEKICKILSAQGRKPSAFICESMLGCGGQIPLPEGFLKQSYQHVKQHSGLCIADEVQVGFARAGKHFWSFELQGVVPDIVTLGKPIGNGHPLGAVITSRKIAEAFANGMEYFNTFGGNHVSCSVGMAVLDIMEKEGLQQNALETGSWLKEKLEALKESFPLIGDVRGEGLFLGVELVLDAESREPAPLQAAYVVERMKSRKILLSTEGPAHNVLKFKPPMVFNLADAKYLLAELEQVLGESPMQ
ncbi:MAG: aminotransferase class III-fold pyridoxal phosphate-dependent enzyme [SAR324 cluster bacterium]|nr:aminotransferase class III-fold pyridoxal phosphate-dependent enzyme [SAR324 cluster bacterium]MBL7035785.1 aminotransferase class III-fold pyridoxal phosphate-dependent enzyme [SAR324 cluster bacterium]